MKKQNKFYKYWSRNAYNVHNRKMEYESMRVMTIKTVALKDKKVMLDDVYFEKLMLIYSMALIELENRILILKESFHHENGSRIITSISTRIKKSDSIIDKMQKKGYCLTYPSLIENINDIAGLRVVCASEKDVYQIVNKIIHMKGIHVLKEKDYIKQPKESGYSSYHLILAVPIVLQNKRIPKKKPNNIELTWKEKLILKLKR